MSAYIKDPDESTEYGFNWAPFLNSQRTIVDSTWTVESGLDKLATQFTTTVTKVTVGGGTAGNTYEVLNEITLDNGEIQQRSFTLIVRNK